MHTWLGLAIVTLGVSSVSAVASPADLCASAKLTAAAKFAQCRLKADAAFEKSADAAKQATAYIKCSQTLGKSYASAEKRYLGACSTTDDVFDVLSFLGSCTEQTSAGANGNAVLGSGFCGMNTHYDVMQRLCTAPAPPTFCGISTTYDNGSRTCVGPDHCQQFPATGQLTCWDEFGVAIPCAGTGQDGDVRAGGALAYNDNGDGTITDLTTGLMWEKKSDDGSLHDKDTAYTWDQAFSVHVAALNAVVFAGHGDWRVPNVRELLSLVDYSAFSPAVALAFNTSCTPGCTLDVCSCTVAFTSYWSSTSFAEHPISAVAVSFNNGFHSGPGKSDLLVVRAVRGGVR